MASKSSKTNGKPGAPVANRNATKHGLRYAAVGRGPKGTTWCHSLVSRFRSLVQAELESRGEISTFDMLALQTACRWEWVSLLANRWLRINGGDMSHSDRLSHAKMLAEASERRDRALRAAGLDRRDTSDVIDALYSTSSPAALSGPDVDDGVGHQEADGHVAEGEHKAQTTVPAVTAGSEQETTEGATVTMEGSPNGS